MLIEAYDTHIYAAYQDGRQITKTTSDWCDLLRQIGIHIGVCPGIESLELESFGLPSAGRWRVIGVFNTLLNLNFDWGGPEIEIIALPIPGEPHLRYFAS